MAEVLDGWWPAFLAGGLGGFRSALGEKVLGFKIGFV